MLNLKPIHNPQNGATHSKRIRPRKLHVIVLTLKAQEQQQFLLLNLLTSCHAMRLRKIIK